MEQDRHYETEPQLVYTVFCDVEDCGFSVWRPLTLDLANKLAEGHMRLSGHVPDVVEFQNLGT